jgi:hypothetical protein
MNAGIDRAGSDPQRAAPPRFLIVGNSHILTLKRAYHEMMRAASRAGGAQPLFAEFIPLTQAEYAPAPEPGFFSGTVFNRKVRNIIARSPADIVVSGIGGNTYNILGLLNHPRPFDFVLPEEPDLPLIEGAEILPSTAVRRALERKMEPRLKLIPALRARVTQPMFHVESPPPIPSAEHLRQYPKSFAAKMEEFGVAPATLRYKLWRTQSGIFRDHCAANDVAFLPVPKEAQDANGMLVERGWDKDPTHASRWYGRLVLDQLISTASSLHRNRTPGISQ